MNDFNSGEIIHVFCEWNPALEEVNGHYWHYIKRYWHCRSETGLNHFNFEIHDFLLKKSFSPCFPLRQCRNQSCNRSISTYCMWKPFVKIISGIGSLDSMFTYFSFSIQNGGAKDWLAVCFRIWFQFWYFDSPIKSTHGVSRFLDLIC